LENALGFRHGFLIQMYIQKYYYPVELLPEHIRRVNEIRGNKGDRRGW
jgi:hypothetical protein